MATTRPEAGVSCREYNRPWLFYLLATLLPWLLWLPAAWASHQGESWMFAATSLALVGLFVPLAVTL